MSKKNRIWGDGKGPVTFFKNSFPNDKYVGWPGLSFLQDGCSISLMGWLDHPGSYFTSIPISGKVYREMHPTKAKAEIDYEKKIINLTSDQGEGYTILFKSNELFVNSRNQDQGGRTYMSSKGKRHISLGSQIQAVEKHKAEIRRLRNALSMIKVLCEPTYIGDIAKEALNSKTKIHLHHTSNELFVMAAKKVIPCLEDWIRTTGFGGVNKRDREALTLLQKAVERYEKGE